MRTVIAICGSTRADSTNSRFIRAIATVARDRFVLVPYPSIKALPHFDPDEDIDPAPQAVAHFRALVRDADGVLICTPEYAMGVPGSLKNALDWLVSSSGLSGKPVMVVTASLDGEKAHASLLATLGMIEAVLSYETSVHIPFARTKVDAQGTFTDPGTSATIARSVAAFAARLDRLSPPVPPRPSRRS